VQKEAVDERERNVAKEGQTVQPAENHNSVEKGKEGMLQPLGQGSATMGSRPLGKRRNSKSDAESRDSLAGHLDSTELDAVEDFCATSETDSAHANEAGASAPGGAAEIPLTSAAYLEKFQREQTVMFSAHFAQLTAANDALVEKNKLLQRRHTTLEAEAKHLKSQLLESKTLAETRAHEQAILLQKYQNLQTAVQKTCQHAHQAVDQLETLCQDAPPSESSPAYLHADQVSISTPNNVSPSSSRASHILR